MNIADIVRREDLWPRGKLNPIQVAHLREAIATGATLPPVVVASGSNILVNGWVRLAAYEQSGITEVEVEVRHYPDEAALYADAVRLNVGQGVNLDTAMVRLAVTRLTGYGYSATDIVEIVRLPLPKVEDIRRGFGMALNGDAHPVALKRGHSFMSGHTLTEAQVAANNRLAAGSHVSLINQLLRVLEAGMWDRQSLRFRAKMDELCDLWLDLRDGDGRRRRRTRPAVQEGDRPQA
jgi:hypothetical protein